MIDLVKLYDSLNKLDYIDCWTIADDQEGLMRMDLTLKSICALADVQSMLECLADCFGDKYRDLYTKQTKENEMFGFIKYLFKKFEDYHPIEKKMIVDRRIRIILSPIGYGFSNFCRGVRVALGIFGDYYQEYKQLKKYKKS